MVRGPLLLQKVFSSGSSDVFIFAEDSFILGCDVEPIGNRIPTFRENVMSSFTGSFNAYRFLKLNALPSFETGIGFSIDAKSSSRPTERWFPVLSTCTCDLLLHAKYQFIVYQHFECQDIIQRI